MTNLTSLPSTLGKSFIVSGFVPALVFVLLNSIFVFAGDAPPGGGLILLNDNPVLTLLGIKGIDLTLLLIPFIIGVLLGAFNTFIIRLFEGGHGFQRNLLMKWLLDRRLKEQERLYGDLGAFQAQWSKSDDTLEQRGLRLEINKIHGRIYTGLNGAGFKMPYAQERLMPTQFGNIWAVIEEYPYLHYGMDGTTFWPRMISVVPKEYTAMLADHKMTIDTLLNACLLAIIFGIEMMVVSIQQVSSLNLLLVAGAFVVAYLMYQAAIATLAEMGELLKSCYDLFRGQLSAKFGLTIPNGDIEAERKIWSGLNAYILAGDASYYPSPVLKTEEVAASTPAGK